MTERAEWSALRTRRAAAPGAADAYTAARLAFELGREVRQLREDRGWSQAKLAQTAAMTQSALARLETGAMMPSLLDLVRVARSLDADLSIGFATRANSGSP
jgi:ribosome-binding protein aMBF1 (putative translation factor)